MTPAERIAGLNDHYVEIMVRLDPNLASVHDIPQPEPSIFQYSKQELQSALIGLRGIIAAIPSLSNLPLSLAEREDVEFLEESVKDWLRFWLGNEEGLGDIGETGMHWETSVSHFMGPIIEGEMFINQYQQLNSKKDFEDFKRKLSMFPDRFVSVVEAFRNGIRRGVTLPKVSIVLLIQKCKDSSGAGYADVKEAARKSPLYRGEDAERVLGNRDEMVDVIINKVFASYERVGKFLEEEYSNFARSTDGIYGLPGAEGIYRSYIHHHTTLSLSPDYLHELGWSELRRIKSLMESAKDDCGYSHLTLREFQDALKDRKQFPDQYFGDGERGALELYRKALSEIDSKVDRWIGWKTKFRCEVQAVSPSMEEQAALAFYLAGTKDVPGIFYVNLSLHKNKSVVEVNATTLHEAVPGHHHQISYAQEMPLSHVIRKIVEQSSFEEGWGLYCEYLGEEMEIYSDPFQYFGRLEMELQRALRLIVDTGLHAKGWSINQSVSLMLEHLSSKEDEIRNECNRYAVAPGQALSYKVGELKIKELRRFAESELGSSFDVKNFHQVVVGAGGNVTLTRLEKRVVEWVGQQKSQAQSKPAERHESNKKKIQATFYYTFPKMSSQLPVEIIAKMACYLHPHRVKLVSSLMRMPEMLHSVDFATTNLWCLRSSLAFKPGDLSKLKWILLGPHYLAALMLMVPVCTHMMSMLNKDLRSNPSDETRTFMGAASDLAVAKVGGVNKWKTLHHPKALHFLLFLPKIDLLAATLKLLTRTDGELEHVLQTALQNGMWEAVDLLASHPTMDTLSGLEGRKLTSAIGICDVHKVKELISARDAPLSIDDVSSGLGDAFFCLKSGLWRSVIRKEKLIVMLRYLQTLDIFKTQPLNAQKLRLSDVKDVEIAKTLLEFSVISELTPVWRLSEEVFPLFYLEPRLQKALDPFDLITKTIYSEYHVGFVLEREQTRSPGNDLAQRTLTQALAGLSQVHKVALLCIRKYNASLSAIGTDWIKLMREPNLELLKLYLEDNQADPSAEDNAPLKNASSSGNAECVAILLKDPRLTLPPNPECVFKTQNAEVLVEFLKDNRFDFGSAAGLQIILEASLKAPEVLIALMDHETLDQSLQHQLAFLNACAKGYCDCVKAFIECSGDPSVFESFGLKLSSIFGHISVTKQLLADKRIDRSKLQSEILISYAAAGDVEATIVALSIDSIDPSVRWDQPVKTSVISGQTKWFEAFISHPRVDRQKSWSSAMRVAVEIPGYLSFARFLLGLPNVDVNDIPVCPFFCCVFTDSPVEFLDLFLEDSRINRQNLDNAVIESSKNGIHPALKRTLAERWGDNEDTERTLWLDSYEVAGANFAYCDDFEIYDLLLSDRRAVSFVEMWNK
ncbi:hypothetical protein HDU97_002799 [Phlyctochytrium planicorne]|nr:hypothetical protein HDU97_002799 [Phlyctochytrium planicorne]